MEPAKPLRPEQLYRRCNPGDFPFTTAEPADLGEIIGQARALEAIRFGIGITNSGYNIYALGPPGVGKHSIGSIRSRRRMRRVSTGAASRCGTASASCRGAAGRCTRPISPRCGRHGRRRWLWTPARRNSPTAAAADERRRGIPLLV